MKTLLIALEYPPKIGGVENYYKNLASYWPEEFIVIDNSENKLINEQAWLGKWFRAIGTIISAINQGQIDWLIIGEILPLGLAALIASYFVNFKSVVFLHGLDFSLATKSWRKRFITKKILSKVNLIICANSYTAKLVGDFIGDDKKIRVANPGIEKTTPAVRSELITGLKTNYGLEQKFVFITLGRLVERKGVNKVLEILPSLLETHPNVRYVIVGAGPEEQKIKNLLQNLSLQGRAFLVTDVKQEEDKWAWLNIAQALIMPTYEINGDYEGFGIVYLEANLLGKPVIGAKTGGVSDAIIDQFNGLLVEPGRPEDLLQAMVKLVDDQTLAKNLGERGRARALADFSWDKIVQKIYTFLKDFSS